MCTVPVDIFPEGVELYNIVLLRRVEMVGHVLSYDLHHSLKLDPKQNLVSVTDLW